MPAEDHSTFGILGRANHEINKAFNIRTTDKDVMTQAYYDLILVSEVESVLDMRDQFVNEEMISRLKLTRLDIGALPLTPVNRAAI